MVLRPLLGNSPRCRHSSRYYLQPCCSAAAAFGPSGSLLSRIKITGPFELRKLQRSLVGSALLQLVTRVD